MQRQHNEFKVGLTVSVVTVLFVVILVFVGKWDTLFSKTKELHVRFHHGYGIQGLRVNDPIRIGGVNVGRVRKILHQKDQKTGELYVHVLGNVPAFIDLYPDAQVTIETKFVGEGGILNVLDVGRKGPKLAEVQLHKNPKGPAMPEIPARMEASEGPSLTTEEAERALAVASEAIREEAQSNTRRLSWEREDMPFLRDLQELILGGNQGAVLKAAIRKKFQDEKLEVCLR